MTPTSLPIRIAAVTAVAAALVSCKHQPDYSRGITVMSVKPSVFVRASFDSDASALIGAWLPDEVDDAEIDESLAARTRCSEFIQLKKIPASGDVEELVGANSGVSGKLGVKSVAHINAERKTGDVLRVKYSAVEKLQAQVDTKGLSECCRIEPNQCTKRYISSVIMGDGHIFAATESSNDYGADAAGSIQGLPVDGAVMYKDGFKWERKAAFQHQYFAFSVQRNQAGAAATADAAPGGDKCEWANQVPESLDGQYFVGVSEPMPVESTARDFAMRAARQQVIKYLGEWLSNEATTKRTLSGDIALVEGSLEDQTTVDQLSAGVARMVKDRKWCPAEQVEGPKARYVVRVLAFFPNSERTAAAKGALTNLLSMKKEKGTLTAEQEKSLQAMIDSIK